MILGRVNIILYPLALMRLIGRSLRTNDLGSRISLHSRQIRHGGRGNIEVE